jgi:hypothetical protein
MMRAVSGAIAMAFLPIRLVYGIGDEARPSCRVPPR